MPRDRAPLEERPSGTQQGRVEDSRLLAHTCQVERLIGPTSITKPQVDMHAAGPTAEQGGNTAID